jgi:uncharacterized membrane protein YciS (DUF1049 family)
MFWTLVAIAFCAGTWLGFLVAALMFVAGREAPKPGVKS